MKPRNVDVGLPHFMAILLNTFIYMEKLSTVLLMLLYVTISNLYGLPRLDLHLLLPCLNPSQAAS
ncbi:MAG: hypothetical protein QXT14_00805 [Candidatus Bathyarchaeia archaeon]